MADPDIAYPEQHIQELVKTINTLRAERDEARRMYCQAMADIVTPYRSPEDIAADRQWDCFRKEAR